MSSEVGNVVMALVLVLGLAGLCWRGLVRLATLADVQTGRMGKAGALVLILALAAVGGDKSPVMKYIATLVTALRDGTILDPSGRVGTVARVAASEEIARLSAGVIEAASNTVAQSQNLFDGAAYTLTNAPITVAYIAADLPRALPGVHTNSNVAATIQRTRQDGATNLVAYVWFSEEPTVVPQVGISYSVAPGVWDYMHAVTNSYPDTVMVDGVPCVEYSYEIPHACRGIVFRPEYELSFGGSRPEDYLIVPIGGIIVDAGAGIEIPFTGTDVMDENLSVTYKGGIAIEAEYFGTNYTGVVTL